MTIKEFFGPFLYHVHGGTYYDMHTPAPDTRDVRISVLEAAVKNLTEQLEALREHIVEYHRVDDLEGDVRDLNWRVESLEGAGSNF